MKQHRGVLGALGVALALLLPACASSEESTNNTGNEASIPPTPCGGLSCAAKTHVCITSVKNEVTMAAKCVPLGTCARTDCSCLRAQADASWKAASGNTDNCTNAWVACSVTESTAATLSCTK